MSDGSFGPRAPSSASVTEPRTVGRYALGERIGAGGMAEVVRARAQGLGLASQDVALKLMHRHLADDPEFVRLFFREAQVASSLRHPNVVNVLDSGEDADTYYLAMELVEGPTLRQLIRAIQAAGETFDLAAAVTIVCHVCEGLHHAHERRDEDGTPLSIVHRDVSPGNVLLSTDGTVKLGDFGVATATAAWTSLRSTTGSIRGKLAYMAPEQARGHAVDRRADVFSTGNVLFELIEGRRLLKSRGEVELMHELLFAGFGDGRPTRDACPPAVADAVQRALAIDPEERFPTALAFANALRDALPSLDTVSLGQYIARFPWVAPSPAVKQRPKQAPSSSPADPEPLDVGPTVTLDGLALDPPVRRKLWPVLAAVGGLLLAFAGWRLLRPAEPVRRATSGFSFSMPEFEAPTVVIQAVDPPSPTPVAAAPVAAPIVPEAHPPSVKKSKRQRSRKRRKKAESLAKPPPNESLFPH